MHLQCIMITVWNSSDRSKALSEDILVGNTYKDIFQYIKVVGICSMRDS